MAREIRNAVTTPMGNSAGEVAVRAMGFSAGGMLIVGVVLYLFVRPPKTTVQAIREETEA